MNLDQAAAAVTDSAAPTDDLLALDEALSRFATEEPAKAELVKPRFLSAASSRINRPRTLPWRGCGRASGFVA